MDRWTDGISIILPTYKRPAGLERALKSLCAQTVSNRDVEIIVADNDPAGSAREFVQCFADQCKYPVAYVHVPDAGVANARNGGLSAARGRFIAFLDDDMEALPGWLESLVEVSVAYKAGVVFSSISAVMPDNSNPLNPYMQPFFSRVSNAAEGLTDETYGTGGSMIDLSLCDIPSPAFDARYNEIGGEDDAFFHHVVSRGAKVAWAPNSRTLEIVPPQRAVPKYVWQRNFAYGQGPTQEAADRGFSGTFEIMKWMMVGTIQCILYAPMLMLFKALGRPKYIHYQARTAQALGKIFWWSGFQKKLYGQNATTETQAA